MIIICLYMVHAEIKNGFKAAKHLFELVYHEILMYV